MHLLLLWLTIQHSILKSKTYCTYYWCVIGCVPVVFFLFSPIPLTVTPVYSDVHLCYPGSSHFPCSVLRRCHRHFLLPLSFSHFSCRLYCLGHSRAVIWASTLTVWVQDVTSEMNTTVKHYKSSCHWKCLSSQLSLWRSGFFVLFSTNHTSSRVCSEIIFILLVLLILIFDSFFGARKCQNQQEFPPYELMCDKIQTVNVVSLWKMLPVTHCISLPIFADQEHFHKSVCLISVLSKTLWTHNTSFIIRTFRSVLTAM